MKIVLRPYKYAGYPQLIKTIRLETKDDELFAKDTQLLAAAAELCYYTVHCSALNIEELRREDGIEALLEAYDRCVSIMGVDSKPNSLHYQVISHVTRCFLVACNSEVCKQKIITLPLLITNVCRVVYFKHILSVNLVTSLAANNYGLQCQLVCNGVLWSLLLFCFQYDYTLDESGVESCEQTNQQQQTNTLAIMSIWGCISLAGYGLQLRSNINQEKSKNSSLSNNSANMTTNLPPKAKHLTAAVTYTQNAINPIQQNKQLARTSNAGAPTGGDNNNSQQIITHQSSSNYNNFNSNTSKNSVNNFIMKQDSNSSNSDRSNSDSTTSSEASVNGNKLTYKSEQKYIIKSEAQNEATKEILNRLLTRFVMQKLMKQEVKEVKILFYFLFE